eukprot:SAG11_NODE_447_length_9395_cov_4.121665_6_plen_59_part_00
MRGNVSTESTTNPMVRGGMTLGQRIDTSTQSSTKPTFPPLFKTSTKSAPAMDQGADEV